MIKLFVYGTLLSGNSNHDFIRKTKFISVARLKDYAIYELGSFPGIRPKEQAQVLGEV